MSSKCRNIWDTLRGDVTTTCSPTPSCYPDAVGSEPSSGQTELPPLGNNASKRNCDVRGENTDQKSQHDALRTSEVSCRSLNTGQGGSAVLENACLLHQTGESSTINLTASNSAKTVVAAPRSISTNFSTPPLCASRAVTCDKGSDNSVQSSRLSVHCRDTSVTAVASLSTKTNSVSERPSTNQPKAFQKRAVEFPGETNSHSEPLCLLKVSTTTKTVDIANVQDRRKQSDACGGSDLLKVKHSRTESRGRATESFSKSRTSDLGSVGADLGHGVGKVPDGRSFLDHFPVPDVVLSTAQSKHHTAQTKPKQKTIRTDHDTNSVVGKNSPSDATQHSRTATAPVLGSGYLLNNFKCHSPDADVEMECLSDAGEIPLFSSPFDAVTANYNSSNNSSLSVCCGSTLAKVSHPEDVHSGVCDLVSSVNRSNVSLSHISRTSVSENESSSSVTNGVVLAKDRGYAEEKADQRGLNDSTNLKGSEGVCDDANVDTYVLMMGDNAYRQLQYYYTSSKNLNNLSSPVSKSDSEAFPDCCDEGFVESPMTTDDTMESVNDLHADMSLQIPTKVSDNDVYESAKMLTNDETDAEFTEIQSAVKDALGRLEADTLQETNALLETNIVQQTNVRPKSGQEGLIEPLANYFRDHDYLKSDGKSVERNPTSKSENVVKVCANNDLMEVNSATDGDVTGSKDSRVSGVCFGYGNFVHDFGNDTSSKGDSVFESVGTYQSVGTYREIGVANLDTCQTHLASTTKTGVSQCNAETSCYPVDISQTTSLNETKLTGTSSKLLPSSSELGTSVYFGDSRISENAMLPCTSISGTSECFPSASTLLPQDRLCPSMNVTDRSHASVTKDLDDSCIARKRCSPFETQKVDDVLSTDFRTNYNLARGSECDGGHSSSESSWGDKSCDTFSETSTSRSEKDPADCKTEDFGAFADKSKKKTSRQPRMLNEIANTVGFITDKRQSQCSDSLFIDSKLLTREERVLQMVHMQITKMEVKEELTRLKKIKSFSETTDQDNKSERGEPVSDRRFPITRPRVQRRIKANAGRTSKCHQLFSQRRMLHNKRIRPNAWSSRAIGFTELRAAAMFKKGVKQSWGERKKSTVSTKSRTALQTGYGGHFHVPNYPHGTGSRGRGRWRSTIDDKGGGLKFSARQADAEQLTSRTFTSDGRPLSIWDLDATSKRTKSRSDEPASVTKSEAVSNNVHHFSSTTEYMSGQGHATPVVPLEVKRLIACHNTGETVLHKAARLGYPDIVLWCCQSRYIDIDTTDNAGYTPLHESCIGSEVCIARYLLHYGASINVASGVDGRRPIHEAVDSDSLEMVRLLLSAGADINLTTYSGKTVQDLAKSLEMKEFIKAYLDDLNAGKDGDKEVSWDLAPVWNGVSDECGMDVFCDLPTSDPKSKEIYVECSYRPL